MFLRKKVVSYPVIYLWEDATFILTTSVIERFYLRLKNKYIRFSITSISLIC